MRKVLKKWRGEVMGMVCACALAAGWTEAGAQEVGAQEADSVGMETVIEMMEGDEKSARQVEKVREKGEEALMEFATRVKEDDRDGALRVYERNAGKMLAACGSSDMVSRLHWVVLNLYTTKLKGEAFWKKTVRLMEFNRAYTHAVTGLRWARSGEFAVPERYWQDMGQLGLAYFELGDYGNAVAVCEETLEALDSAGAGEGVYAANVWYNLGMIRQKTGDWNKATQEFERAHRMYERLPEAKYTVENLNVVLRLAECALKMDMEAAMDYYAKVRAMYAEAGWRPDEDLLEAYEVPINYYNSKGDKEKAGKLGREKNDLFGDW